MSNLPKNLSELSSAQKRILLAELLRQKANGSSPSVYPLSYNQKSLWIEHQFAPQNSAYNTLFAARIVSDLDIAALKTAFQKLSDRHPCLRTTYTQENDQIVQKIRESSEVYFQELDASSWNAEELKTSLLSLARSPFDLETGPIWRVYLLTRSRQEQILLLTIHHIALDFWSLAVILDELSLLYPASKKGIPASLPSLEVQYVDFGRWQSETVASAKGEELWSYWQQKLAGELPILNLPTDLPRPPMRTFNGAWETFQIDTKLTKELQAIAKIEGTTLYVLLLAAFQVLLYRYTNQEDILVGTPTAGRNKSEFAGIVGFFVNPVVLRGDLSGNPTFKEFLTRVRDIVLEALNHQDYPFPLLVEKLVPKRDPSRAPLFQVLFALQRPQILNLKEISRFMLGEAGVQMNLGELVMEPIALPQMEGQFELMLELFEIEGKLHGAWHYNTDLFEAASIKRMVGHFQTLLAGIVANRAEKIAHLPLLTAVESDRLLGQWNHTRIDYPEQRCIHELFEAQVEKTPNALAARFEDREITYQELNMRANQLARYLITLGVGPEVLVAICVERSLDMLVGLLGIMKAGGAYVPLDPAYPPDRLSFILEDTQASVLLTQQKLIDRLPSHKAVAICLDTDSYNLNRDLQKIPIPNQVTDRNLAYVIYTSGSTGKPKGVQIAHKSVVNFLSAIHQKIEITARDVLLAVTTITFDIAALEMFLPLMVGASLVIVSREVAVDGKLLLNQLQISEATLMQATPATWRSLLAARWQGSSEFKILCGGEALSQDLVNQLQGKGSLWNLYGPTETTIWSTMARIDSEQTPIPIGSPIANTQVYILDPHLQPVPIGIPGELYISGFGLARGYLHRPDLTADKFIPHPFSQEIGERLYKTGDLVRYLANGNIEYLGRIDRQLKIRGFRIELGEIEAVLNQHLGVQMAVVTSTEDILGDRSLVAYIVGNPDIVPTITNLRSLMKEKLPQYMIPSDFVILSELPLTSNGKVNLHALPPPDRAQRSLSSDFVPPRTDTEQAIAAIWVKVLGLNQVSIHENFFELGGHSLLATQVVSQLRATFCLDLPLSHLFESPTVAELANRIEKIRWTLQQLQTDPSVMLDNREEVVI